MEKIRSLPLEEVDKNNFRQLICFIEESFLPQSISDITGMTWEKINFLTGRCKNFNNGNSLGVKWKQFFGIKEKITAAEIRELFELAETTKRIQAVEKELEKEKNIKLLRWKYLKN